MKYTLFGFLVACTMAFMPAFGFADTAAPQTEQEQLAALDKLIKEFKDARQAASMKAYQAGGHASQYLGQNWVDYKEAIRQQQMYQEQVKLLDAKIAELEKQKAELQKK